MNNRTQGLVLTLFAAVCLRLALTDAYLRYVNGWMKWPLIATACLLLVLSARTVVMAGAGVAQEPSPRAAWLMLVPVVAVFAISPPALGAYAAERNPVVVASDDEFAYLPKGRDGAISMTLGEFMSRAQWDDTLTGHTVALTGFVSTDKAGDWFVTRLAMSCCAADAVAYRVQVNEADRSPRRDSWVRVVGTWRKPGGSTVPRTSSPPVIEAQGVTAVKAPRNTYE